MIVLDIVIMSKMIIKSISKFTKITQIQSPEAAYILGLLWADGNVEYNGKNYYRIRLSNQVRDFKIFATIFRKTGPWVIRYKLAQTQNRQPQGEAVVSNKWLGQFLIENDYHAKECMSADKILEQIPNHLKHYWFLGLLDGDGCITTGERLSDASLNICSNYDQNWRFMENLFQSLRIKYCISKGNYTPKNQTKQQKCSKIRITNSNDILKFCDYIYQSRNINQIGLKRKFEKYSQIKKDFNKLYKKRITCGISKNTRGQKYHYVLNYEGKRVTGNGFSVQQLVLEKQKRMFDEFGAEAFKKYYGFDYCLETRHESQNENRV